MEIFRDWWSQSIEKYLNQSIPLKIIYADYQSYFNVSGRETWYKVSKNKFKSYWLFLCKQKCYYFKITRTARYTIYNTYENEFLAKK